MKIWASEQNKACVGKLLFVRQTARNSDACLVIIELISWSWLDQVRFFSKKYTFYVLFPETEVYFRWTRTGVARPLSTIIRLSSLFTLGTLLTRYAIYSFPVKDCKQTHYLWKFTEFCVFALGNISVTVCCAWLFRRKNEKFWTGISSFLSKFINLELVTHTIICVCYTTINKNFMETTCKKSFAD